MTELQVSDLLSVPSSEIICIGLYMDVGNMPGTVRKASNRVEQGRRDQITDLDQGMVVTVAEGGKLQKAAVAWSGRSKFLCED